MPKLKPTTEELQNRTFIGIMEKHQIIEEISDMELSKKIGVTTRTLANWRNNTEVIPLKMIRDICKILKIPNWEKVQMI